MSEPTASPSEQMPQPGSLTMDEVERLLSTHQGWLDALQQQLDALVTPAGGAERIVRQ